MTPAPPLASGAAHAPSEFARRAAAIGEAIHDTSGRVARLAQLARRTGLFDDPAAEIGELSTQVKRDIQTLNDALSGLQGLAKRPPSAGAQAPKPQAASHGATVVDCLRRRLKDATQEFREVLTQRTDSLKLHADRRALFSAEPGAGAGPGAGPGKGGSGAGNDAGTGAARGGFGGAPGAESSSSYAEALYAGAAPGSSFLPPTAHNPLVHRHAAGVAPGTAEGGPPSAAPGAQSQAQMQVLLPQQDAYRSSRAAALRDVESTIGELGSIFQQLAHLVHEQGEVALRIDDNMEDTLANVEGGQAQLLKYLGTISSNRWLMAKIFGLLMLFLTFFIVFVA